MSVCVLNVLQIACHAFTRRAIAAFAVLLNVTRQKKVIVCYRFSYIV